MILLIATHELRRLFKSMLAWMALAVVSFFGAAFFYVLLHTWARTPELRLKGELTETVVADFLQLSGILLLLLTPLLTMSLFSEERRTGTLKLILSSPIRITHLVIGKFLGITALYLALLTLLTLLPATQVPASALDFGQVASALLGLLLMAVSFAAVGLFVSSLCTTQLGASLGTFGVLFLLWMIGLSDGDGGGVFVWLSMLNHSGHFREGLFHSADLVYYLLLCGGAIGLTIWRLDAERMHGGVPPLYRVSSIATLGLMCLLIALLAWTSTRYDVRYDWTRHGRHSLSHVSQELLTRVPDVLRVSSYARRDPSLRGDVADFVARYQHYKTNLELHFVDPDAVPNEVRNLGVRVDGELVLHYQGRVEHVRRFSEQDFSVAVMRLARGEEQHWLAFVEGHGERELFGSGGTELSEWVRHLGDQGFKVQPLNLIATGAIPDNTSVLILTSPRSRYPEAELTMLQAYLQRGGNLLWLVDPGELYGLEVLNELLAIRLEPGVVVDPVLAHPSIIPFGPPQYGAHAIVQGLPATTVLPGSASILFVQGDTGAWQRKVLLSTSERAWNETGDLQVAVDYDEDADRIGPLTVGISLQRQTATGEQRAVVIGDGDFLSNAYLGQGGNLELGMRIVNWLTFGEQLLGVPSRVRPDSAVHFSGWVLRAGAVGFLLLLPTAFVLSGLFIRFRRRRRPVS